MSLGLALGLACSARPASAAVAGAWETFATQTNVLAWQVDNNFATTTFDPIWSSAVAGDEYVSFTYWQDYPLTFFADQGAGGGALVGDYQAQKIAGISCDVLISDLAVLSAVECAVYATGPNGLGYYHSGYIYADEFSANGWWTLWFSLNQPWYYYDGTKWVTVATSSLTAIREVDVTFFPVLNSAGGSVVGLDNVKLEPTVVAPKLAVSVTSDTPKNFKIAFTPVAIGDAVEDLEHALGPHPAEGALPATLLAGEVEEKFGDVDHAGGLIHHDHPSRSHDGSSGIHRIVIDNGIRQEFGYTAARRTSHLDSLETLVVLDPSAQFENHIADGHAHWNLYKSRMANLAGQCKNLGAFALLGAVFCIGFRAVDENPGDVGVGFNVVDVRRLFP